MADQSATASLILKSGSLRELLDQPAKHPQTGDEPGLFDIVDIRPRAEKGTEMEKPTVGPDGRPRWQPNGARQRYAKRMSEEVDPGRVIAVAGQVLRNRKVRSGEIGPHDGISPSIKECLGVIEWCDFRQLRLLREMAESLIVEKEWLQ